MQEAFMLVRGSKVVDSTDPFMVGAPSLAFFSHFTGVGLLHFI